MGNGAFEASPAVSVMMASGFATGFVDLDSEVDVARYLDEARYRRELAALRRLPVMVAHRAELAAPGRFLTREVLGTPLLLTRDEQGAVHALINVCRHRGARVEREARRRSIASRCSGCPRAGSPTWWAIG